MTNKTFEKYCLVVDEWFVNGFNGTKAYQKFYPKANDETASTESLKILRIPKIESYVNTKKEEAKDVLKTSHESLLQELENWAYSDITETIQLTPDEVKELPIEIRRLITKYKNTSRHIKNNKGEIVETIQTVELSFVSKERAMEMIHKHTGFYAIHNDQKKVSERVIVDVSNYNKKK